MPSNPNPNLAPGDVLHLDEDDYRFGLGPLVLRVTAVLGLQRLADGPWISVQGVPVSWDGRTGDERHVLVRVSAVARSVRRPDP